MISGIYRFCEKPKHKTKQTKTGRGEPSWQINENGNQGPFKEVTLR